MRFLDLCAGCGGATRGLVQAGLEHVGSYEIDPDACATLRAAGHITHEVDIRDLVADDMPAAGFWWASPPCQAWSQAGKRLGRRDPRNGWPWTFDLLRGARRPETFIAENVTGMVKHLEEAGCRRGERPKPMECPACYLAAELLPELREMFPHVEHRVLNAADYGCPQVRRRVIIIASTSPVRWPKRTHSQAALVRAKWVTGTYWTERGLEPCGEPSKAEGRLLRDGCTDDLEPWATVYDTLGLRGELGGMRNTDANPNQERPATTHEPAPTVGGKGNQMFRCVGGGTNPHGPDAELERTYRDITHEPSPVVAATQNEGNRGPWLVDPGPGQGLLNQSQRSLRPHEPSTTVDCGGTDSGHRSPSVKEARWRKGEHPELMHEPSVPVAATEYKGTNGKSSTGWTAGGGPARASDGLWLATGRRRLTVEECLLLQDMPADYPVQGETKRSRFRQVGNAVPPRLAEVIVRGLLSAEDAEPPAAQLGLW